MKATRIIEEKNGSKWAACRMIDDATQVLESLAQDLIAKKINECRYIRSIKRKTNYNGTQTITVDYGNGTRSLYTIPEH